MERKSSMGYINKEYAMRDKEEGRLCLDTGLSGPSAMVVGDKRILCVW